MPSQQETTRLTKRELAEDFVLHGEKKVVRRRGFNRCIFNDCGGQFTLGEEVWDNPSRTKRAHDRCVERHFDPQDKPAPKKNGTAPGPVVVTKIEPEKPPVTAIVPRTSVGAAIEQAKARQAANLASVPMQPPEKPEIGDIVDAVFYEQGKNGNGHGVQAVTPPLGFACRPGEDLSPRGRQL